MDTRALFLSTALAGLFACSQAPSSDAGAAAAIAGVARTVSEVAITSGTPVTFADLSVEGMSCEMMCGGSIKKALAALPGVVGTEIKFEEGEAVDHAIVTFDPAQVNDAQLVEAVQKIHDGQYKVMAVNITKQVVGDAPVQEEKRDEKAAEVEGAARSVSAALPAVVMPSLLRVLSRLLGA